MKYCQYAILAQGDDIPQLLGKKWRDSRFLYAHLKIFKVASILCFMSIQIPIPKVSFYTPLALPTTKILSYLYMYDYTSKPPSPLPTVSNQNYIHDVLCIKPICITYQLLDIRRGINRIRAD